MTPDRRDYVRRLIAARCPELTDADLARLSANPVIESDPPDEVMEAILAVLSALEARLEALQWPKMTTTPESTPRGHPTSRTPPPRRGRR